MITRQTPHKYLESVGGGDGLTPLGVASYKGHFKMVELLLVHGACCDGTIVSGAKQASMVYLSLHGWPNVCGC